MTAVIFEIKNYRIVRTKEYGEELYLLQHYAPEFSSVFCPLWAPWANVDDSDNLKEIFKLMVLNYYHKPKPTQMLDCDIINVIFKTDDYKITIGEDLSDPKFCYLYQRDTHQNRWRVVDDGKLRDVFDLLIYNISVGDELERQGFCYTFNKKDAALNRNIMPLNQTWKKHVKTIEELLETGEY